MEKIRLSKTAKLGLSRFGLNNEPTPQKYKEDFIIYVSIIAVLTFIAFSIADYFTGNIIASYFDISLSIITYLNLLALKKDHDTEKHGNILLINIILTSMVLMFDGSMNSIKIFWFYTFPILAFFLKGSVKGFLWISSLLFLTCVIVLGHSFGLLRTSFIFDSVNQLLSSLFVITILMYFYEYMNERNEKVIQDRSKEVIKAFVQLTEEIELKKKTEKKLAETIEEINKKNGQLEESKAILTDLMNNLRLAKKNTEEEKVFDDGVLSSIGEGLIATDIDEKILLINEAGAQMLGISQYDLIGRYVHQALEVTDENGNEFIKGDRPLHRALSTGEKVIINEYHFGYKGRNRFPVSFTASPIKIKDKKIGAIVVFRDMTKEKEIDKAKSEFVSMASHQLKTPLTSIKWYMEMLLSGDAGKLSHTQKDYLEEIEKGNNRMTTLVNDLLSVSRIDMGSLVINPITTNLLSLTDDVISEQEPQIKIKKIKLIKDFDKKMPDMEIDPTYIRIVLQNLVSNAIKYTPENGQVRVELLKEGNDHVVINVTDTGYGIPKDVQPKIFQKMFRAGNVKSIEGTGLGLYVVKYIIERSNGTITFESEENKGTTFTVKMPIVLSNKSEVKTEQSVKEFTVVK